jgi:hypothetical protein
MIRGMTTKRCNHCKAELPLTHFYKTSTPQIRQTFLYGRLDTCIKCKNAQSKAWKKANWEHVLAVDTARRHRNPEKSREATRRHRSKLTLEEKSIRNRRWDLQKNYGMTVAEYDAILLAQGGVCAICSGTSNDGRRLHVDHNHATEENRGLLCNRCNLALERLDEIPDWHTKALNYLAKYLTVRMDMQAQR